VVVHHDAGADRGGEQLVHQGLPAAVEVEHPSPQGELQLCERRAGIQVVRIVDVGGESHDGQDQAGRVVTKAQSLDPVGHAAADQRRGITPGDRAEQPPHPDLARWAQQTRPQELPGRAGHHVVDPVATRPRRRGGRDPAAPAHPERRQLAGCCPTEVERTGAGVEHDTGVDDGRPGAPADAPRVHERDRGPGTRRGHRRGQAGEPAADHRDVHRLLLVTVHRRPVAVVVGTAGSFVHVDPPDHGRSPVHHHDVAHGRFVTGPAGRAATHP
jgi:hypothetical protein